jgi:type VI protein secretion system component Hcp
LYLYLPIVAQADPENPPTLDDDAARLSEAVKDYRMAQDDNGEEGDASEDDNLNFDGTDEERNILAAVDQFHKKRPGWTKVLAWSMSASNNIDMNSIGSRAVKGNLSDLSLTRRADKISPILTVMVMLGEVTPHAFLRVIHPPKKGRVEITEFGMKTVQVVSSRSGGSGGARRMTENISISFQSFVTRCAVLDLKEGIIEEEVSSYVSIDNNEGAHPGRHFPLKLSQFCRKVANENFDKYDRKDLVKYPRDVLKEFTDVYELATIFPKKEEVFKERKFFVTIEDATKKKYVKSREISILKPQLTVQGIKTEVAKVFGLDSNSIKALSLVYDSDNGKEKILKVLQTDVETKALSDYQLLQVEL